MMPFKRRNLLLVLAIVLAAALAVTVIVHYRSASDVIDVVQSLPAGVELALQEIDYTHSEAGVVRWRLKAERAERLVSEGQLAVKNLSLTFFNEHGTYQSVLRADEGESDKAFSELHVRGDVVVASERYRLSTDRLVYKQSDQKIYSDSRVFWTADGLTVKGHGLILDLKNRSISVYGGVEAVLSTTGTLKARQ
jgi:LPS export ABC transporter protein LptC